MNPLDLARRIAIGPCATHGLKASRNQHYASSPAGRAKLVNRGKRIEWERVVNLWRFFDKAGKSTTEISPLPRLTRSVAEPDSFSKMSVGGAKVPYQEKTIVVQMELYREKLGLHESYWNSVKEEFKGREHHSTEMLCARLEKLRGSVENQEVTQRLKDEFAHIKFSCMIHFIYISRFLNGKARLVKTPEKFFCGTKEVERNVAEEVERMKQVFQYFGRWKKWCQAQNPAVWGVDKWERLFLHGTTMRNLIVSVAGFLLYARMVLEEDRSIHFVPYLHGNQSSLEGDFATVRKSSRDTPLTFQKALLACNMREGGGGPVKWDTSSYSSKEVANQELRGFLHIDFDFTEGAKEREEWCRHLVEERKVPREGPRVVHLFPEGAGESTDVRKLVELIGHKQAGAANFPELLAKSLPFKEVAKLASLGPCKLWFEEVIRGRQAGFCALCRRVNLRLVMLVCESGRRRAAARTVEGKSRVRFHQLLFRMLQDNTMNGLISEEAASCHPERMAVAALVQVLHLELEKRLSAGILAVRARCAEAQSSVGSQKAPTKDVIQLFGWAVYSQQQVLIGQIRKLEEELPGVEEEEGAPLREEVNFLTELQMYEAEAAMSESYIKNWYGGFLRAENRGYMSLVKEEYCPFGLKLVEKVAGLVTQEKLKNNTGAVESAKAEILQDPTLQGMFLEACSSKVVCGKPQVG